MTTTIPRAEIEAIAERYGSWLDLDADPTVEEVRTIVQNHRYAAQPGVDGPHRVNFARIADDLDALADRYEKMAQ
jgi:hypothetical protein